MRIAGSIFLIMMQPSFISVISMRLRKCAGQDEIPNPSTLQKTDHTAARQRLTSGQSRRDELLW
jgi:hypothetical protein